MNINSTDVKMSKFNQLTLKYSKEIEFISGYVKKISDFATSTAKEVLSTGKVVGIVYALNFGLGFIVSPIISQYFIPSEIVYMNEIEQNMVKVGLNSSGDVFRVGHPSAALTILSPRISSSAVVPLLSECQVNVTKAINNSDNMFTSDRAKNIAFIYAHESSHCHSMQNAISQDITALSSDENMVLNKFLESHRSKVYNLQAMNSINNKIHFVDATSAKVLYDLYLENFADVRSLMILARSSNINSPQEFYSAAVDILTTRTIQDYAIDTMPSVKFSNHETSLAIKTLLANISYDELMALDFKDFDTIAHTIALTSALQTVGGHFSEQDVSDLNKYNNKIVGLSSSEIKIFDSIFAKFNNDISYNISINTHSTKPVKNNRSQTEPKIITIQTGPTILAKLNPYYHKLNEKLTRPQLKEIVKEVVHIEEDFVMSIMQNAGMLISNKDFDRFVEDRAVNFGHSKTALPKKVKFG